MGKKSNGKLRAARYAERVIRKGLDQVQPDPYAYVYGSNGVSISTAQRG